MSISVATFLLEIGTEELPADFARLALPQLEKIVSRDLFQKRLSHGLITCTSTPRRIVLFVEELADSAKDSVEEFKGPPLEQAFSNGVPTKAAVGFAKRFNLEPSKLEIKETSKRILVGCGQGSAVEILEVSINNKDVSGYNWWLKNIDAQNNSKFHL